MASPASSAETPHHADTAREPADANDLARELLMPTGEPAVAVFAAALLLGMIWFAGAFGHDGRGVQAMHAAAPRPSLRLDGAVLRRPPASRSTG
jgi:hypothetical protein